jgi:Beta-propeller repeat
VRTAGNGSDGASSIALDSAGDAFLTGSTYSGEFPTTANAIQLAPAGTLYGDAFVLVLNPQGAGLVYSSYFGGSGGFNLGTGIAVDPSSSAYVVGTTMSTSFPTTPGVFQSTAPQSQNGQAAFVTKVAGIK